mmetsp:Transcript_40218/g.54705  ORF Transcript_40218/g.54705 Transcript_40218/m.54705 type:complete len:164 (-) Transcript_40218:352-843(-)
MFAVRHVLRVKPSASAVRAFSDAAPAGMTLNLNVPHMSIYSGKSVDKVIIPGVEGEYGVTEGHTPIISQLKPGVLSIVHDATSEPEKYFITGGFALTHDTSVTDVSAFEAVKLDDLDADAIKSGYASAQSAFASATAGSVEQATAQIEMETSKDMALALGMTL